MAQTAYGLTGFREDSDGLIHAAFRAAPLGEHRIELLAPKRVVGLSMVEQERWAQQALAKLGHVYDGICVSSRR